MHMVWRPKVKYGKYKCTFLICSKRSDRINTYLIINPKYFIVVINISYLNQLDYHEIGLSTLYYGSTLGLNVASWQNTKMCLQLNGTSSTTIIELYIFTHQGMWPVNNFKLYTWHIIYSTLPTIPYNFISNIVSYILWF